MSTKYEQLYDGDWFRVNVKSYLNQCCDCGLVHRIKFRKLERGLMMQVAVDRRRTAAVRRGFKFDKDVKDE